MLFIQDQDACPSEVLLGQKNDQLLRRRPLGILQMCSNTPPPWVPSTQAIVPTSALAHPSRIPLDSRAGHLPTKGGTAWPQPQKSLSEDYKFIKRLERHLAHRNVAEVRTCHRYRAMAPRTPTCMPTMA